MAVTDHLVPLLPDHGAPQAVALLVLTLAALLMGVLAQRWRSQLRPTGLLPTLARGGEFAGRLLALFFGLGALAAMVPHDLRPARPWVIIAGAVAVGWSSRHILEDVIAWLLLTLEGRISSGQWMQIDGTRGRVVALTPRAVWLRDETGRQVAVPNRSIVSAALTTDDARWPRVQVQLRLPGVQPDSARAAICEAVEVSPWVAPGSRPEVHRDPEDDSRWTVTARVLEPSFEAPFAGTLSERVRASLSARDAP